MSYGVAYQRCLWQARPLTEVDMAGGLEAAIESDQMLQITGWALARESSPTRIEARSATRVFTEPIGRASPDIAPFGSGAEAENCRFEIRVPIAHAAGADLDWTLWAIDAAGKARHFATVLVGPRLTSDRPVFVLGPARSGTTAIGNGLRRALGLPGYGEGHTMPLLMRLMEAAHGYYAAPNEAEAAATDEVLLAHVGPEEWQARLAREFRSVYHNMHGGPFIDKSPGALMIAALPMVMAAWPDARIVFSRRRGIENVESRRRKFPDQAEFIGHCHDWTAAMVNWHELRTLVPESQRIEIDQFDLATDPRRCSERLSRFLELGRDQGEFLRESFETQTPERTSASWRPLELGELSWSAEERRTFIAVCGPAMDAFGYSLDSTYWKGKAAATEKTAIE